jgi:tRNA-2-methylthio-N6-dimethylallyladenosine synthase
MDKKHVYLKSFGCQMNVTDSEQLIGMLNRSGYELTECPDDADLILLNTCAIRGKAEQKVFSDLGRLKTVKTRKPNVKIGVAGCVAQSMGKGIFSREPAVDFVMGTRNIDDFQDILEKAEKGEKVVATLPSTSGEDLRTESIRSSSVHAYVPIIYGCENYCSYCVVPFVRGPERSRPARAILHEIQDLANRGYKEITLLGQNVNSYGKKNNENKNYSQLLELIHEIDGIHRIRFVTSHPRDLSIELIETMARLSKVCESLHLPVQSGSDRILEAMNRGYTRQAYIEKLSLLREKIPGIAITTDMIVGFPGETLKDFEETLTLIHEAEFDHLFGFCFSPRSGTPAAKLPDPVDEEISRNRLEKVFDLQKKITLRKNQLLIGQSIEVLVEGPNKKDPERLTGRTRTNKIVHFEGDSEWVGRLVTVRIDRGLPNCLVGTKV